MLKINGWNGWNSLIHHLDIQYIYSCNSVRFFLSSLTIQHCPINLWHPKNERFVVIIKDPQILLLVVIFVLESPLIFFSFDNIILGLTFLFFSKISYYKNSQQLSLVAQYSHSSIVEQGHGLPCMRVQMLHT